MLLVMQEYEIFYPAKVTGHCVGAVTANPHKWFNGLKKGRLSHGFSLILETSILKHTQSTSQVNIFKASRLFITAR